MAANVTSEEVIVQLTEDVVVSNITEETVTINLSEDGTAVTVQALEDNVNVETSEENITIKISDIGLQGRPGMIWRDAWNETSTYYVGDIVSYESRVYINTKFIGPSTTNFPSITTGSWDVFSERGLQGVPGAASFEVGPKGNRGTDGTNGIDGANGTDGIDGTNGTNGIDGTDGSDGLDGNRGPGGLDGNDGANGLDGNDGTDGTDGNDGARGNDGTDGNDGARGDDGLDGIDGLKGDNGDDGEDGSDGTDGTDGSDGVRGVDGSAWFSSTTAPSNSQGADGDFYLETSRLVVWENQEGTWVEITEIKGLKGDTGTDGSNGNDGTDGTDGTNGTDGTDGINGTNGSDGADGADGSNGTDGTDGYNGSDGTDGSDGSDGSDGTDGSRGADGSAWFASANAPTNSEGEDGDFYLETSRLVVWENQEGTWVEITEIKGIKGDPGIGGDKGDDGEDGSDGLDGDEGPGGPRGPRGSNTIWYSGVASPDLVVAGPNPDDYYFETDSKIFWKFLAGTSQQPGGEWVEIASLPGQFADTPNRGNILGIDFDTSAGVVRGTVDATDISGGGGGGTSVGILDLPGSNATSINSKVTLTNGRCFGPNDLGDDAFLDGLESESACLVASTNNVWNDLDADALFLTRVIGTHLVTQDEVDNGIRGLLQISILALSDGADLDDTIFTIELGGAVQTFELPSHGGVVDIELVQIPEVLYSQEEVDAGTTDSDGNLVTTSTVKTPARDQRPKSAGVHSFTISKRSKSNSQDPGGVISGGFSVLLNNDGGAVIIKPAVEEVLDDQYGLIFKDSPNAERELGVNFTRIDREDAAYPDGTDAINRDVVKATVDTRSLNLSVPGFEHSGTTGVTEFFPATNEVNVITYSGKTAEASIGGALESTIITIGENSISGKLTTTPEFIDISDELTNVTSVAYDGSSLYVAVANNLLYTSVTGEDWILAPYNLPTNAVASLSSVTYGGGRFIVVGKHTDGDHLIFYTVSIQSPSVVWNFNRFESLAQGGTLDVKYFNSRFWYYGSDTSDESVLLLNASFADPSNAGLGETSLILDMDGDNISDILIGHHKLGTISYTTGSGWNTTTVSTAAGTGVITSVVYGNSTWFVGTNTGKIFRSTNLTTWTSVGNSSNTSSIEPGVYHDGIFIMPTNNGDVFYSSNATTMTKLSISGVSFINRAWAGGKRYFLTGTNSADVFQVARLDDRTEVIITLPDHITNPLVFPITSESNANSMATQIAEAINNANPNNLSTATVSNNRVSFSATIAGNNINGSISLFSHSEVFLPITTFVVTNGETPQINSIKDTIEFYNLTASFGRNTTLLSLSLDFGLTGDTFRDAIVAALETIGGYTIDITVEGRIITTNTVAGTDSDLLIGYNKATEGGSTAIAARSLPLSVKGINAFTDGDLTSLIYTIEDVPYTVTFPSGVATANQQALFARSTINTIRGNPITDDTDFVMSVNGDLLNFRLPEGVSASDHTIALNSPVPDTDPPYSGGTLVNAANPVGTYVLPVIASNVLSLTEFRDTVSTAEYKGVDFTEDKSVVAGKVAYTWNDYTAGGLFQELTTDNSGTTVKLQFSKTDDGLTTAFVYRRIIGAGTTDYSDIVYAEESLTTILATRGG